MTKLFNRDQINQVLRTCVDSISRELILDELDTLPDPVEVQESDLILALRAFIQQEASRALAEDLSGPVTDLMVSSGTALIGPYMEACKSQAERVGALAENVERLTNQLVDASERMGVPVNQKS